MSLAPGLGTTRIPCPLRTNSADCMILALVAGRPSQKPGAPTSFGPQSCAISAVALYNSGTYAIHQTYTAAGALAAAVLGGDSLQNALQVRHVVVPEPQNARPRQVAAVLDAEVHVLRSAPKVSGIHWTGLCTPRCTAVRELVISMLISTSPIRLQTPRPIQQRTVLGGR